MFRILPWLLVMLVACCWLVDRYYLQKALQRAQLAHELAEERAEDQERIIEASIGMDIKVVEPEPYPEVE